MKKKIKYVFVSILILMVFITCYSRYMEQERLVMKEIKRSVQCRIGLYAVCGAEKCSRLGND